MNSASRSAPSRGLVGEQDRPAGVAAAEPAERAAPAQPVVDEIAHRGAVLRAGEAARPRPAGQRALGRLAGEGGVEQLDRGGEAGTRGHRRPMCPLRPAAFKPGPVQPRSGRIAAPRRHDCTCDLFSAISRACGPRARRLGSRRRPCGPGARMDRVTRIAAGSLVVGVLVLGIKWLAYAVTGVGRALLRCAREPGERGDGLRGAARGAARRAAGGRQPPVRPPQGRVLQRGARRLADHRRGDRDPARGLDRACRRRGCSTRRPRA